jgi:uncharacterized membrane protein
VNADSRRAGRLGWLFALLCVALASTLRIHAALSDPGFDRANPIGMLRSDPGLVDYVAERIDEAHGLAPADFRADPRIEYPESTDVPATFAVGQEFVVAWAHRIFAPASPLHVTALWVMGIWASLAGLAVYGLALELCGSAAWAILACALYAALPANYRTVGWIFMNEDFSVPWFAFHLWLLARAARVRTPLAFVLAAVPLGCAVSTWHAMSFFAALEALCVFAWFLATGRNPFAARGAPLFLATLLVFAVCVPVLRSTFFALSLPMQIGLGMAAAALSGGKHPRAIAHASVAVAFAAALAWSRFHGGGIGEYGHVFALLGEKIRHLGRLPADPAELSVEVRMMWQGPFATLDPAEGLRLLGVGVLALAPAAAAVLRRAHGDDARDRVLALFACASVPVAWLVERTILLPGLLLPVVGAVAASRLAQPRGRAVAISLASAAVVVQAWTCVRGLEGTPNLWYAPPQRAAEIRALVDAIPRVVPEGEAIAADFMSSTAILAHTRHPILFQPKWESRRTRARAVELFETFYSRGPDDLRRLLATKYRCRYLVVDRSFFGLQRASLYVGGSRDGKVAPGSCADVLLSRQASVLEAIPGYKLVYRSPEGIRYRDGSSTDFYRIFELAP